jgi:hypothetical protein
VESWSGISQVCGERFTIRGCRSPGGWGCLLRPCGLLEEAAQCLLERPQADEARFWGGKARGFANADTDNIHRLRRGFPASSQVFPSFNVIQQPSFSIQSLF